MDDKKAFTLAEILITLSIIGIVAALTIPNLIQNYKRKVATVRLKNSFPLCHRLLSCQNLKMAQLQAGM